MYKYQRNRFLSFFKPICINPYIAGYVSVFFHPLTKQIAMQKNDLYSCQSEVVIIECTLDKFAEI